jgi:NhaP-type Na+/H+ or K+/H+ antiporter
MKLFLTWFFQTALTVAVCALLARLVGDAGWPAFILAAALGFLGGVALGLRDGRTRGA